jgi:hypothetical protein
MACDECLDLCVHFPVRDGRALKYVDEIVRAEFERGVITVPSVVTQDAGREAQREFVALGGRFGTEASTGPDGLSLRFECLHCGEQFSLSAPGRSHNSDWCWRPISTESIIDYL